MVPKWMRDSTVCLMAQEYVRVGGSMVILNAIRDAVQDAEGDGRSGVAEAEYAVADAILAANDRQSRRARAMLRKAANMRRTPTPFLLLMGSFEPHSLGRASRWVGKNSGLAGAESARQSRARRGAWYIPSDRRVCVCPSSVVKAFASAAPVIVRAPF